MLQLAKEYGRSPQEVEGWDEYWFTRATALMEGESIDSQRRMKDVDAKRRK